MTGNKKKLLALIQALPDKECQSAIHFVEYLTYQAKHSDCKSDQLSASADSEFKSEEVLRPLDISRPETESVVAAIKRLSKTYPMLDKSILLNKASEFMTQHVMQGREATDVIDELEDMFKQQYTLFEQKSNQQVQE